MSGVRGTRIVRRGAEADRMSESVEMISGWERVAREVEKVRLRLLRATGALEGAGVPYAVVGGHAVAEWVGRVDPGAVRNTQDVDLLIRRVDFEAVRAALESAGFVYRHVKSIDMFLDGPGARARDAVHIVYGGERVRPEYETPAPDVVESERGLDFRALSLDALVRMKLTSFRLKDRVHVQDLIEVGLVDETWLAKLEAGQAARLRELLEHPEG